MVFRTVSSRSAKSIGLVRKSNAPRFIAVRMFSISPYAEMITDLIAGLFRSPTRSSSVRPSISGMLISERMTVMSLCSSSFRRACTPFCANSNVSSFSRICLRKRCLMRTSRSGSSSTTRILGGTMGSFLSGYAAPPVSGAGFRTSRLTWSKSIGFVK